MARSDRPSNWALVLVSLVLGMLHLHCTKESQDSIPYLSLKTGTLYPATDDSIPLGGTIRLGVLASGGGSPLTYLKIEKVVHGDTLLQVDKGIYIGTEGLDEDFFFNKDTSQSEIWLVTVSNADRNTATISTRFFRGTGSSWGPIHHYTALRIGMQANTSEPHFLDVHKGMVYTNATVAGHESDIDLLAYFYVTSGNNSPTLSCPAYTAMVGYYPVLASWPVKNMTLYDYYSTDNNLVDTSQFHAANNDSLLVNSFQPALVSGNCKYCYTGKVIPFRTNDSKLGLIKVVRADESADGIMELEIKIQQ